MRPAPGSGRVAAIMWEVLLYRLPGWVMAVVIVGGFAGFGWAGLILTRRWSAGLSEGHNELAGYIYAVLGVVYAVILGMTALVNWERFNEVSGSVDREAASAVDLARALEAYPAPDGERLQAGLRDYLALVVTDEWAALRRGEESRRTDQALGAFALDLSRFEPRTRGQEALHSQTLVELDELIGGRRFRLHAGEAGLEGPLWGVLLAGGFLTVAFAFGFRARDQKAHGLLVAGLGAVIGLVIFWVFETDHPMLGTVAIRPDAFYSALAELGTPPAVDLPSGNLSQTLTRQ